MTANLRKSPVWIIALSVYAFAAGQPSHAAEALTLDDYFAAALRRSETIGTQTELIRQAEERYNQSGAALRPTLSGVASSTWEEGATAGNATRERNHRIRATQSLFRGFSDIAALRQTKALLGAQNQDYASARVQLFKDVAQNFYDVLSIEQDLNNFEEEIKQNLEREKELNGRVRIGRSRTGEVLTVHSTISTLRAQVEQLQGQLRVAREVFAFLGGLDPATPLRDAETVPATLEALDTYLARLALRPDVMASEQRLAAAKENVTAARGGHLPSVDLNANRYLDRTGSKQNVDWDVQLELTIPIYAGGLQKAKVGEAVSQQTQSELSASQVRRQAEQEIRSTYQSVVFDQSQLAALEKATDASRKNYETQLRDYRLGLVTNLDVLQALTAFQGNQRALDRARYTAKFNYLRLQAASVRRPALPEGATP